MSPENVTDIFQASKEAFDALVFYFSRLEMTGQSDKDSAVKLGKALNVDSFLVVRVNSWEYMRKEGDNVGRVGPEPPTGRCHHRHHRVEGAT